MRKRIRWSADVPDPIVILVAMFAMFALTVLAWRL
jgi:hypothetical protein